LGNHSENHKNMSELSIQERKEELMKVHDKVKELTGVEMNLFRPPYGDYNNDVIIDAKDCGYYTIQWDVDTLDIKRSALNTGFITDFRGSTEDINQIIFLLIDCDVGRNVVR